ncbi:MAG TPA: hypothetical protein VFZ66_22425 [Herpetosiphonaceae bacterium]
MSYFRRLLPALLLVGAIGGLLAGCGATTPSATTTATPDATQSPATTTSDIDQARAALTNFFAALHGKRYDDAARLYGGSYQELFGFNPRVAADDHVKLLEEACTVNGFQCLEINEIVRAEAVSPTEFHFMVEFKNEDGSLFTRGPTSGATAAEQPSQSQWPYTVKKVGDAFLVQELPVYVP